MNTQLAPISPRHLANVQVTCNEMTEQIQGVLSGRFTQHNQDGTDTAPAVGNAMTLLDVSGTPLYHLVAVDTARIPHKANKRSMMDRDTLDMMTMHVGWPVRATDRLGGQNGLFYIVLLHAGQSAKLPVRVDLPLRPAGDYVIGFGQSARGAVWRELESLTHILIAGSSDSGKSTFLRSLVYQLAKMSQPVELYLADMEGLTFEWARDWPIVNNHHIADDIDGASAMAEALLAEMERRKRLYNATGRFPESLSEYHSIDGVVRLPWIVAIWDEFTAFLESAGKYSQFTTDIAILAQRARKYGITLVLAGQDFKADLLPSRISNQLKTRVQFRCATTHQSRAVLGVSGAERLTVPGRALVKLDGRIVEMQTFWVDKAVVIEAAPKSQSPRLSERELRLARWAIKENGGAITNADIERELGLKKHPARDLALAWEREGWLKKGFRSTRTATDQLIELVNEQLGRVQVDKMTTLTGLTS